MVQTQVWWVASPMSEKSFPQHLICPVARSGGAVQRGRVWTERPVEPVGFVTS